MVGEKRETPQAMISLAIVHSGTSAAAVWRSTSTMVGQVGQSFVYGCSM
jgi:hypothetical protein